MARHKTKKRASKQMKKRQKRLFLPYPALLFILLCIGVLLVGWTLKATGDDIVVKAKVPGPPVTSPAVITNPTNGSHFTSIPITVSGTCPANAAYVEIFRNNLMSGTAICDASSDFSLSVDLFPGQNDLVAHVFNVTDDEGPVSNTVTVYYDLPPPPSGGTNLTPSSSAQPLVIRTDFLYRGYYIGQQVSWPIEISGGSAPYAINVDWGDGHNDVISRGSQGNFNLTHTYQKSGGYKNSYTVKIKAADANGQTAYMQFFVIITPKQGQITGVNIFNKPGPSLGGTNWLLLAWPIYLLVLLMVFSYWLGEREEIYILRRRKLLRR